MRETLAHNIRFGVTLVIRSHTCQGPPHDWWKRNQSSKPFETCVQPNNFLHELFSTNSTSEFSCASLDDWSQRSAISTTSLVRSTSPFVCGWHIVLNSKQILATWYRSRKNSEFHCTPRPETMCPRSPQCRSFSLKNIWVVLFQQCMNCINGLSCRWACVKLLLSFRMQRMLSA